jgi:hypothetical protein
MARVIERAEISPKPPKAGDYHGKAPGRAHAEAAALLHATQAIIRAGYSAELARFQASENLTKPNIEAAVAELMAERLL